MLHGINFEIIFPRYDGVTDLATAECYNPMTNSWNYITPMGTKRSCLGICAFDGLIYVGGGYDGASCLSDVLRYDTLTGVWSSCTSMSTRRRYCRLAVLDNCIYALGGFDSANYQASVEKFDPRVGRWMAVPSMKSRRSSCGVTAMNGYLYCIGGNSQAEYIIESKGWGPPHKKHRIDASENFLLIFAKTFSFPKCSKSHLIGICSRRGSI